jgi:hypothetical protein
MNIHPDELIEDALHTYPLAPVPARFSDGIMKRVRVLPNRPQMQVPVPFRLTWMDYALAFFVALLPPVGFGLWSILPYQAVLRLQIQWQLLQWSSLQPVVGGSLAAAGVLLCLAMLFSLNLVLRPRLS